jgi:hypothetical protein
MSTATRIVAGTLGVTTALALALVLALLLG